LHFEFFIDLPSCRATLIKRSNAA